MFGFAFQPYAAIPFVVLALYFAYFFRDPNRSVPEDSSLLVSPADGKVMEVVSLDDVEDTAKLIAAFVKELGKEASV